MCTLAPLISSPVQDEVWSRLLVPGQTVSLLRQGVKAGLVRETELAKLQRTWAALKKEGAPAAGLGDSSLNTQETWLVYYYVLC